MTTAITIQGLCKTFQSQGGQRTKVKALDHIDLEVSQGEILGVLGPNGAGKTTLLNTLSTLLLPDAGTIEILGIQGIPRNFNKLRSLLNMSSGYPNFPWSLTVQENLRFYARLYGLRGKEMLGRINQLIQTFELGEYADRRFEELSSGTKQRLSLAKALLNSPKIIFLDEPTVGLDPDVAIKTREVILKIMKSSGVTVLLTTHNMQEAEDMCQRIAFIKKGQVLRLASPAELKRMEGKNNLEEVFINLAQQKVTASTPEVAAVGAPIIEKRENITGDGTLIEAAAGWANRCLAFAFRNYLFAIRNLFAFMELLFWPIVSLISIGLMGDFLQLQEKSLAFVLTGAIAAGVLQVTQLDVAYSLLYEVWSKSMKHTFLTPVGISENLFGSWLIGMLRGVIVFAVLGLSAIAFFGFQFPSWPMTLIFLAGIFACSFLLGLLVSVFILMFGQKAEITAWMFAYLFMLLCGIYYPIDTLPAFFYNLAQIVPITYFLEYFRENFGFHSQFDHLLLRGFVLIIIYFYIGLFVMRRAFHTARKKGIIVRLSE